MEESRVKKFKQYREKIQSIDEQQDLNKEDEIPTVENNYEELDNSEVFQKPVKKNQYSYSNVLLVKKIRKEKTIYIISSILSFLILSGIIVLGILAYVL